MRVLFLHFDTCTSACRLPDGARENDEGKSRCAMHCLASLAAGRTDVYIVVHSNWRQARNESAIVRLLGPLAPQFSGLTPHGQRWDSVLWWLSDNADRVEDYCILDSNHCEYPRPPPRQLIVCPANDEAAAESAGARFEAWLKGAYQGKATAPDARERRRVRSHTTP